MCTVRDLQSHNMAFGNGIGILQAVMLDFICFSAVLLKAHLLFGMVYMYCTHILGLKLQCSHVIYDFQI